MHFDFSPNFDRILELARAFEGMNKAGTAKFTRLYKNGDRKDGKLKISEIETRFTELTRFDIDIYYRPGNPTIRGWAYLELNFTTNEARTVYHGDPKSFKHNFDICVDILDLKKSRSQVNTELHNTAKAILDPDLYRHLGALLETANYSAALNAAVVYTEDQLRLKIGPAGNGLTGSDLAQYAFKSPGNLTPPLAYATNPKDNTFLLLKGWFGLVRNLHGHQVLTSISPEDGFNQLLGVNYILWIIKNSK